MTSRPGACIGTLTKKDFTSDQEVRWCPGCGDYAILAAVQGFMPELGIEPQKTVFVSGIGCSGRFTYYMDTYGIHGIHGRAPAIATGIATANPELSVWVVTGDGDGAVDRRQPPDPRAPAQREPQDPDVQQPDLRADEGPVLADVEEGKVTKSTPFGSVDHPFNPIALALGAEATFVARTIDNDRQHLTEVLRQAAAHQGAAFVEIYQNCNVFNDGAFDVLREKPQGVHNQIRLVHGEPIVFDEGHAVRRGRRQRPAGDREHVAETTQDSIVVHDMHGRPSLAFALAHLSHGPTEPTASGCSASSSARCTARRCTSSSRRATERLGEGDLGALLHSRRHLDGGLTDRPRLRLRTGSRSAEPGQRLRRDRLDLAELVRRPRAGPRAARPRPPPVVLGPRLTRNPDVFGKPSCSRTGDASSGWPVQSEPAARRSPRSSSAIAASRGRAPRR